MIITKATVKKWQDGVDAYTGRDYSKAINYFKEIGDSSKMSYNIGMCFFAQNRYSEAAKEFDTSLRLDNYLAIGYFTRGVCMLSTNDNQRAIADFTKSCDLLHGHDYIDYHQIGLDHTLTRHQILYHRAYVHARMRTWDKAMTDVVGAQKCSMLTSDETTAKLELLKDCINRQQSPDAIGTFASMELFLPPHIPQVNQPNKAKLAKPIPIKTSIEGFVMPDPKPSGREGGSGGGAPKPAASAPPAKSPPANVPSQPSSSATQDKPSPHAVSPSSPPPQTPPQRAPPKTEQIVQKPSASAAAKSQAPSYSEGISIEQLTSKLSLLQTQYARAKEEDDLDQAMMLRSEIKKVEGEIVLANQERQSKNQVVLQQLKELENDYKQLQAQYEAAKSSDDLETAMLVRQAMKQCQTQIDELKRRTSEPPPNTGRSVASNPPPPPPPSTNIKPSIGSSNPPPPPPPSTNIKPSIGSSNPPPPPPPSTNIKPSIGSSNPPPPPPPSTNIKPSIGSSNPPPPPPPSTNIKPSIGLSNPPPPPSKPGSVVNRFQGSAPPPPPALKPKPTFPK